VEQTALIINRVLPIFLLIGLGYWVRRRQFVAESTVDDLRKIVVNLALPAVLFTSFVQIELQTAYIAIFVTTFSLCVALLILGRWLQRALQIKRAYFPFMMTGFEYGMLGVSLFGSAYGLENIGYIAVLDLGHELFIWFVFLAFLLAERDGIQRPAQLASAFVRSPVIIAILAGIALNLLGLGDLLYVPPATPAYPASLQEGPMGRLTESLYIVWDAVRYQDVNWLVLHDTTNRLPVAATVRELTDRVDTSRAVVTPGCVAVPALLGSG